MQGASRCPRFVFAYMQYSGDSNPRPPDYQADVLLPDHAALQKSHRINYILYKIIIKSNLTGYANL